MQPCLITIDLARSASHTEVIRCLYSDSLLSRFPE